MELIQIQCKGADSLIPAFEKRKSTELLEKGLRSGSPIFRIETEARAPNSKLTEHIWIERR
jgi:hypothetical protein